MAMESWWQVAYGGDRVVVRTHSTDEETALLDAKRYINDDEPWLSDHLARENAIDFIDATELSEREQAFLRAAGTQICRATLISYQTDLNPARMPETPRQLPFDPGPNQQELFKPRSL